MTGFCYILPYNGGLALSLIKTNDDDLSKLNHQKFSIFNKSYQLSNNISLFDILEMDDEFIDFIVDIEILIATNNEQLKYLNDFIEDAKVISNNEEIDNLAKIYAIKMKEGEQNSLDLCKLLLMIYRKKEIIKFNPLPLEKNHITKTDISIQQIEVEIEAENLIIDGVPIIIDYNKKYNISKNADSLLNMFKSYYNEKKEITLDLIIGRCTNFKVFFTLMEELLSKKVIQNEIIGELKTIYFNSNENKRYQEYLKKSSLKGIDLEELKKQLDLYIYLKNI